jgi:hypothetical protein
MKQNLKGLKIAALLVHLTAALVFLQLVTGGYFLINLVSYGYFLTGIAVGIVSRVAMIAAIVSKPKYNTLRYSSATVFALLVLAGFTSDKSTMFPHYVFAILAFGAVVASMFYAVRWNRMATGQVNVPAQLMAERRLRESSQFRKRSC